MTWLQRVSRLRRDVEVLYLAVRDPRTPWYAKALGALVVAYAFSPIDLIPDPIPVLGHLDDVILIPLGVWAAIRLIPAQVLAEARGRTAAQWPHRARWTGALVVIGLWLLIGWWIISLFAR